jgi:hypothetical protein
MSEDRTGYTPPESGLSLDNSVIKYVCPRVLHRAFISRRNQRAVQGHELCAPTRSNRFAPGVCTGRLRSSPARPCRQSFRHCCRANNQAAGREFAQGRACCRITDVPVCVLKARVEVKDAPAAPISHRRRGRTCCARAARTRSSASCSIRRPRRFWRLCPHANALHHTISGWRRAHCS